jgi:putative ABC transport system permease protein
LIRGRALADSDDDRAPAVALISESLRRRLSNVDPVGTAIEVHFPGRWDAVTIVGIVGDVASWPEVRVDPTIYMSYRQRVAPPMSLVARSRLGEESAETTIRRVVRSIDPDQTVRRLSPMSRLLEEALATSRFVAVLLETFAAFALVLAVVGIFGVTSYLVSQRHSEIGIRTALGARPRDILGLFVGQSLRRSAIGVALGLLAALALTRYLAHLLFGVTATDAATLFAGAAVLLLAGALGAYLPARAGARVDPTAALRGD